MDDEDRWEVRSERATRMLMLKALIKSGAFYRLDHRNPDDGGAGSPVRAKRSPDAGSGSAALPEPDEPASGA